MKVTCIHCGKTFGITAANLGGRGYCPHCKGEIVLPSAREAAGPERPGHEEHVPPWQGTYRLASFLTSFFIHLTLFVLLSVVTVWGCQGGAGGPGEAENDVLIGSLPSETLSTNQDERFQAEETPAEASKSSALTESMELEAPSTSSSDAAAALDAAASPAALSGGAGEFELGAVAIGGGGMGGGGGNWDGMIQSLRRNGLDIVICFDSTGSMGGEINQVKDQIKRIGATLTKLVPKTRIGLVTYRDSMDDFEAKGVPLTQDLNEVVYWLNDIRAGGGGDHPEAVQAGLEYAVSKNNFRPAARKVILLFGDAPPHPEHRQVCLAIASDFARQQKGIVSTVTCRNSRRLAEFVEIAQAGGGEAFLTTDERQLMTQLIVLVFGSQHRGKVVEAFKLLEK